MPDSRAAFSDDAVTCSVTQPLGAGLPASDPEESPPDVAFRTATTATIPTTTATSSGTRLRPANTPPHGACPDDAVMTTALSSPAPRATRGSSAGATA